MRLNYLSVCLFVSQKIVREWYMLESFFWEPKKSPLPSLHLARHRPSHKRNYGSRIYSKEIAGLAVSSRPETANQFATSFHAFFHHPLSNKKRIMFVACPTKRRFWRFLGGKDPPNQVPFSFPAFPHQSLSIKKRIIILQCIVKEWPVWRVLGREEPAQSNCPWFPTI